MNIQTGEVKPLEALLDEEKHEFAPLPEKADTEDIERLQFLSPKDRRQALKTPKYREFTAEELRSRLNKIEKRRAKNKAAKKARRGK